MHPNPVPAYCKLFADSGKTPTEFARWFCARYPIGALQVMETIGSWPSSEPELRALQKVWPWPITIAERLRAALAVLEKAECRCHKVVTFPENTGPHLCKRCKALADFPDPDVVGQCIESLDRALNKPDLHCDADDERGRAALVKLEEK